MDLFPKDRVEFILKDRDSESALIKRRTYLAGLFISLFITLLLSRVFFLTVIENDHYREAFSGSERSIIISAHNSNWEIPGMSIRKTMEFIYLD